jgi:hypothetical protein
MKLTNVIAGELVTLHHRPVGEYIWTPSGPAKYDQTVLRGEYTAIFVLRTTVPVAVSWVVTAQIIDCAVAG